MFHPLTKVSGLQQQTIKMNNGELKKKIVDVLRENIEYELHYFPDDNYTEVEFDYDKLADSLIAVGIGDVKTAQEIGASATAMAVLEAAKAEHRAARAERAFSKLVHEMYEHGIRPMCDEKFFVESCLKDAEKELAEEDEE